MSAFDFEEMEMTPSALTAILRETELAEDAAVESIDQIRADGQGLTSTIFRLNVRYSNNITSIPANLLMKVSKPEFAEICGKEAFFYSKVANDAPSLPLVRCFGTAESFDRSQFCVVLEDLCDTHFQTTWPVPPQITEAKGMVRAVAKLHANWWHHPFCDAPESNIGFPGKLGPPMAFLERAFPRFCDQLGDLLSGTRRLTYEQALAKVRELVESRNSPERLTLIHGDAHVWNFLLSKQGSEPSLIDWQSWRIDFAAHDLAYMIGLHWHPDRRRNLEEDLLHLYTEELSASGRNYAYDQLWLDYRISVIRHLFTPVSLCERGIPPAIWFPHMERSYATFCDLDCFELL